MQVNIFDGYAIYAIKDNTVKQADPSPDDADADAAQNMLPAATTFGGNHHG